MAGKKEVGALDIEVRINWTPNQWRRFCGQADITPLVELASVAIDQIAMLVVEQRLTALVADTDEIGSDSGSSAALIASGHGR